MLSERGIVFCGRTYPVAFQDRCLVAAVGEDVEADEVVSLPRLRGVAIDGIVQPIVPFEETPAAYQMIDEHPEACIKLGVQF